MPPEPKFWLRHWLVCNIILVNFYLAHIAPPNLILERTPCIKTLLIIVHFTYSAIKIDKLSIETMSFSQNFMNTSISCTPPYVVHFFSATGVFKLERFHCIIKNFDLNFFKMLKFYTK